MRFAALASQPLTRSGRSLHNVFCVKPVSGGQWFVGEAVEGATLSEICEGLSPTSVCVLARDLITILKALERANCVHGHLCLDNVIIDSKGMVWVANFELACRVGEKTNDDLGNPALPANDVADMGVVFEAILNKASQVDTPAWAVNSQEMEAFHSLRFFSHSMTEEDPKLRPSPRELASKVSRLKISEDKARHELAVESRKVLNRCSGANESVFANTEVNIPSHEYWHRDELALKLFLLAGLIVAGVLAYWPSIF